MFVIKLSPTIAIVLPSSVVRRGACCIISTVGIPAGDTTAKRGSFSVVALNSTLQLSSHNTMRAAAGKTVASDSRIEIILFMNFRFLIELFVLKRLKLLR